MNILLEYLALLLIAVGVGLWSIPAGLVVSGVLLLLVVNFGTQAEDPDQTDEA